MELYDAIFYRKSTRKYSNKKVKEGLLEEVKNACSQITYLNKELDILELFPKRYKAPPLHS